MKFQYKSKNMQNSDKIRLYTEKKIGKLDKLIEMDLDATVSFISQKNRQRVEITLPINSYILRAEEEGQDFFTAIDLVADKLEKQILKYKARYSKKGRTAITKLPTLEGMAPAQDSDEGVMVRVKKFSQAPMTMDEAIMQMEMVGHSFFVFNNAEADGINVVYRRNDGHYGLLEPEA